MRLRLASLVIGLMLAACSPRAEKQTVISFWALGHEAELVVQMLPEFERTHPSVKVQVQQLPWTAAHEKLLTAFAGDAMPDVAQMGNTWIPEMAALRSLEPLDPWIARSAVVNPADYFSGIWDTNVIDGVTQGVPWYVDTRLLFYRHDLLAKAGFNAPPKTWDEWRTMMQAIQAHATPQQHALLLPTNEYDPLIALALQQSDPMLREQMSRGNFSSPGFRRALSFYAEIFAKGWAPGVTNNQIANVWNEFGRGSFVFYISGPWNIEEFKRRLPPEQQSSWMTAPLPGPDGPGASSAGGSSLVVFRSSRHKPEAWALIEYLSAPAQQLRFHAISDNLPPRRSAWADPRLAADVYARAFRDQLERAKPAPAVPEWERIANELQLTAARVVGNGESIDAATRELDARVDGFLEKRRWMLAQRAKAQP